MLHLIIQLLIQVLTDINDSDLSSYSFVEFELVESQKQLQVKKTTQVLLTFFS
jgi:hypothetical protein